jgi:putative addiction module component (TIGR02574 family)
MATTLERLGINHMTPEERLHLIEEIWDSLSERDLGEIPESHRQELDRRIAAADANPGDGSSWEEVKARLEKRQ